MTYYDKAMVLYKDCSHPEEQPLALGRTAYRMLMWKLAFHQGCISSRYIADNAWQQFTGLRNAKQGLKSCSETRCSKALV